MQSVIKAFLAILLTLNVQAAVYAADRGTPDEAIAMVKRAVEHVKKYGREKAFSDIADQKNAQFHDRDLYIFVYDMDGNCLAHGNNPRMVGKNLLDMKDHEGRLIVRGFVDIAKTKGSGWHDYTWPDPVSKSVGLKSAYVERLDNIIIGSGIYKP